MEILPRFALKEGVVAIGEIGYDEQTELEDKYFRLQIELAKELDLPVMVHTPHRDKKRGTSRSMDVVEEHGLAPSRVVIDHNNEETVREVLDRGFWAAFSIYPFTKMGNERMVEIVRDYGAERIFCDFGLRLGHLRPAGGTQDRRTDASRRDRRGRRSARSLMPTPWRPTARAGRSTRATGSARRRSTSARSTWATRSCAAARTPRIEDRRREDENLTIA